MNNENNISKAGVFRWIIPIVEALIELGGTGKPQEVREIIIKNEKLTEDFLSETRGKNRVNKFINDVAFARQCLVSAGYIDNKVFGKWTLTDKGKNTKLTEEIAYQIFTGNNQVEEFKNKSNYIDLDIKERSYWIYSPGSNACMWDEFRKNNIMGIGWDEFKCNIENFNSKEDIKRAIKKVYGLDYSYRNVVLCLWQFAKEIKIGDIIFVKKGMHKIIGKGIVTSDYIYDTSRETYLHIHKVEWQKVGEWDNPSGQAPMKTLTNITSDNDYVNKLLELFEDYTIENIYPKYTKEDFLNEVFMEEYKYNTLVGLLNNKYNIILQGAPGVGKTFVAKRLAYSIIGEKNTSRVNIVQFHQSYSYEDFIQGYRPNENGFILEVGSFYRFCKLAEEDDENLYFFIIDEINRGNLSKIFGEIMMLIENNKRGEKIKLLYKDELFNVPKNVRIIGTMNTADRSLAIIDYALRRRFGFFDFEPAFESKSFKNYVESKNNNKFRDLISKILKLNIDISNDESLGEGFRIGHSYFCTNEDITDEFLNNIVEYEIIPLIKEYWFDEPSKVKYWSQILRGVIK